MSVEIKEDPASRLIAVLKCVEDIDTGRILLKLCGRIILQLTRCTCAPWLSTFSRFILTHAQSNDSIKTTNHDMIHSKARAGLGNQNTKRALYVFTKESLLHKLENPDDTSFDSFVSSSMNEEEEARDP